MNNKSNALVTIDNDPTSPPALIRLAIEKGADIGQLEKLMDLQERWQKGQAKIAFMDALSKFQAIVPPIKKGRTANMVKDGKPLYSYKFADLASIAASIKSSMQKCGLSYRWEFKDKGATIECSCLLSHRQGHTEITTMESINDTSGGKNAIQSKGSTQTYLQRYSLIGALGLSTAEEDKDGAGTAPGAKQQQQPPAKNFKKETITDENEEDMLRQWKSEVDQCKTRIALTALYNRNRKVVDDTPKIKAIFKTRQGELPETPADKKQMP